MVASDYSEAGNTGTISMEFTGKDTADSLIGMYADTNSSLTNAGTISGKADTARGRVTGMQTRLTSYYADFVNKAVNSGKIELSGSSDNAGGMEPVGDEQLAGPGLYRRRQVRRKTGQGHAHQQR